MAARCCPAGEVLVDALALNDQGAEQPHDLALVVAKNARHDGLGGLGGDGCCAVGTLLHTNLYVEQPKEVMDFGEGAHRAFTTASAGSLFNGHGGRNARDGIDIWPAAGLNKLTGISIE